MNLSDIALFVAATDAGSLAGAARRCGASALQASRRIAALEQDMGVRLFHRTTRALTLTDEGERFLPFARTIMEAESEARAALGFEGGQVAGTLRITASLAFGRKVVTPALIDFLKLHPGLSKETFAAVVSTANSVHMPFAGHVSFDVGVWWAARSGYATIDHLDGFVESLVPGIENMKEQDTGLFGLFIADKANESGIPKLMDSLRTYHIWVVPTQSLAERWFHPENSAEALGSESEMKYIDPNTVTSWITAKKSLVSNPNYKAATVMRLIGLRKKLIYECNKNGIGLLLGSDAPQVFDVPGFSLHHELRYMVDAGLSPYDALKAGTVNVGKFLKRGDIGVIKVGATSDLVLLNGNPLADIDQSKNIEGVMLGNLWMDKQYRDAEFKKLEKHK